MLVEDLIGEQRRKGLRVALAVSVGFTVSVASGAIVPFLGPLFAAQFLLSSAHPLPPGKTLGMGVLILVVGIFMRILTAWFGDEPATLLLLLGLIYFSCFIAQTAGKGGAAIFLILVVAVMVPLLGILNKELASSILSILTIGVVTGGGLMWLAHALIPEPRRSTTQSPQPAATNAPDFPRALANTAILLSAVTICLTSDNLTSALVIPITVVSLLGQLDVAASGRASLGLVIVNLLGGVIASVAYTVLTIRPNLFSMFVIVLIVCLLLGGRAAARSPDAKVYAGALTIFLILFGLGVSPLPGSAAESFSTRILFVAMAIGFVFLTTALLWQRPRETHAVT